MNRILYEIRCKCNEEISVTKKRKSINRSEGKPVLYPNPGELTSKTFQIKYEKQISSVAKFLLNSFQNKYLYYAIDDIVYLLNSNCGNSIFLNFSGIFSKSASSPTHSSEFIFLALVLYLSIALIFFLPNIFYHDQVWY